MFWARVNTRALAQGIQPQEKMRLYTVAFQHEDPLYHAAGPVRERVITPVTVQVLHLPEAGTVLIHYSLEEPDRKEQWNTLPETEIRQIEPHLASMVEQAMRNVDIDVENCTFEVQCTGSNLVRDRDTAEVKTGKKPKRRPV